MDKDWVKIYSTTQQHLAEILRGLLEEHGIQAIVLNHRDTVYNAFGEYELYVHADFVVKAKHLIQNNES